MNAAAYLDDAGKPKLRQSVTGFIDVLGFSHLSTKAATIEESQQFLEMIASAIQDARIFTRSEFAGHPLSGPARWVTKFFSDNLVFGLPADDGGRERDDAAWFAVRCVQRYQLRMALNGFFVRGALTEGPICLTDEIVFGAALVDCYRLETHASIVPRVVLTPKLQEILAKSAASNSISQESAHWICRDIDGWWFVNYLDATRGPGGVDWELVEQHKRRVLASLAGTTNHDVLPKFGWSCRYHNLFCHWNREDPGFAPRYRIERVDEQSTMHRLVDVDSF